MNRADYVYFRIISLIQSAIGKSESYYDAIRNGVKIIIDNCSAEYAVVWHCEDDLLHPYYWLSPTDFTSVTMSAEDSIIRQALIEEKTAVIHDFAKEASDDMKQKLSGIEIRSLVITPFSFGEKDKGLIFYMSTEKQFAEDDVNVFEILSLLTEISMGESQHQFRKWKDRTLLMSCKSICKSFQNGDTVTKVLKGINFDVFEGEFLCLLGESGCGKSTFLNIIGGLERADSGVFEFMGKEFQRASEDELTEFRRKNIGFVFQSYNLMPNLTARQNLNLIGELVDDPVDSVEALSIVGLSDKINSYPSQLSGGQQQRVSIARALVKRPKIIMADEPTAALDYNTSIEVLQVLSDVVKSGTALIMVTHNEEITKMADRVVRFRNGKVYEVTVNSNPVHASELVW